MLSNVIQKEFIQLDVEAENFEDAIVKATKPLLDSGLISIDYVNKIIEIYEETGPYIVITKNVALPHAPHEFGARGLAIGLTILRNPVKSGHEINDPVKYLFSLSSPDSHQHLESISSLVNLLSQPEFIDELSMAKDKDKVISIIKKYEGEN